MSEQGRENKVGVVSRRAGFLSKAKVASGWLAVFFLSGAMAKAQLSPEARNGTHGIRTAKALRIEGGIQVDGQMQEPAWEQANIALGFRQRDPQEGADSTERTEFRVLYTTTTLYFGIICYDSSPSQIIATERRRDNNLQNDDTATIVLDTFHDHRNSFMFRTNALGTQYDALITEEGRDTNTNWDEKWDVASQITEFGWVAEIAIPFKSLRVAENDGTRWGLDLERVIRRKNEQTYWNDFRRGFKLESVSQAGHLVGLEGFDTGMRFRVKPYLLGGFSQRVRKEAELQAQPCPDDPIRGIGSSPASNAFGSKFCNASDMGMEVMKYRITPSLTADLTWNTDFAQTEIDAQQVNLDSRFSLFFPEKREFFLEGAGLYEFASSQREGQRELKLFHSRRIGISPKGNTVPIVGGGRITGRVGKFSLGLMNIQTDDLHLPSEQLPESNYSVVRVKGDLLQRSTMGAFLVNTEQSGSKHFNRVYGADANFTFRRYLNITSFLAKSDSPGFSDQDWAASTVIKWESDFWELSGEFLAIEPNFYDDLGFVFRRNIRRVTPVLGIRPRPKSRIIRQFDLKWRGDYVTDRDWNLVTRVNHFDFRIDFQSGDSFLVAPHNRWERVDRPFEFRHGITVPAGNYSWPYFNVFYTSNPGRPLSGRVTYRGEFGFFGGDLHRWTIGPEWKLSGNLSLDVDYQIDNLRFPKEYPSADLRFSNRAFVDHIVNAKINYAFNNRWLTTTTIQYNTADSVAGLNFRLNYIFRPGDDFFLVYNEGRALEGARNGQKDRSLAAKLTYSFDF